MIYLYASEHPGAGRMDWSEEYKPRTAKRVCLCFESEGSRALRIGEA